MTVMILRRTTSSPDESLASNLQLERALLNSARELPSEMASWWKSLHRKKLCRAVRAAEVIGPVDSGERMIARNGERSVPIGNECMSG